ncbi:MAG: sigma-70 family RNA polymerase sigma factor [Patulibacter sp.]|nr:sigma-70 family RNA polymerase sigma factor [Patulibacter sp.]
MPPTAVHSPTAPSSAELSHADRSLVALAGRGDQRAFERLFQRHRAGVHAYALRMLTDHAAAEDVVQEVFVSAMRSLRGGNQPVHVRAWLHEIARCACVDHWRGSERRREVSYDAPDSLSGKDARQMAVSGDVAMRGADDRESLACLQSAFEDLPPLQHRVLVQRELEGRSSHEIAERLGISPTVVEGQLARGRRSLAVSFRELQSGERCVATRDLCEASLDRALGVRERARVRVHLRTCSGCRRHARAAGVEPRLFDPRVLSHLGFLLPLPLLRRFPLSPLFASSESLGAAIAGKALVGAAVLAAGGGGALVVGDLGPDRESRGAPVVQEAELPVVAASGAQPDRPASAPRLVLAAASLTPGASEVAPELRLAIAAPETGASQPARPAVKPAAAPSREKGGAIEPGAGGPPALDVQSAPLTLPRFVAPAPPRVQRLAPVADVPDEAGYGGSAGVAPIEGGHSGPIAARNGKQRPVISEASVTEPGDTDAPAEPRPDEPASPAEDPTPEPGAEEPTPVDPAHDPTPVDPAPEPVDPAPSDPETPPVDGGEPLPDPAPPASTSGDSVAVDPGAGAAGDPTGPSAADET